MYQISNPPLCPFSLLTLDYMHWGICLLEYTVSCLPLTFTLTRSFSSLMKWWRRRRLRLYRALSVFIKSLSLVAKDHQLASEYRAFSVIIIENTNLTFTNKFSPKSCLRLFCQYDGRISWRCKHCGSQNVFYSMMKVELLDLMRQHRHSYK